MDEPRITLLKAFELGFEKASREDFASAVGIHLRDLDVWLQEHVEYDREFKRGFREADEADVLEVEEQLIKSATGFEGDRLVKNRKTGAMERVSEFIQPSARAQELFLERRKPDRWEKPEGEAPKLVPPTVMVTINQRLTGAGRAPIDIEDAQVVTRAVPPPAPSAAPAPGS